jgi:hypothetical protein
MKLRITLFKESRTSMRQQWGTATEPALYGTTTIPPNIWSQMDRAALPDGSSISAHCVEGESTQGAGART